ncbi:MAG: threonylcarbamoyl-AMP synthase [Rhodocyclaceae bacterium]|jgi:tRNA threonylcarbamoyl adenosine modification protein (Sua5/YciO/YrdC/YwlC family)|nr:threonylcarbamoyl-AMP synthase [Rhodocyclaceae bacterium]MBK6553197.1 threonylcarbamoyl-AMP synthase [Rhodocyclaceae bacterium]MBK9311783.1 threonylcarbamoyl-AMP synthase [Rhodocyclaceae bacterium]
MAEVLVIHHEDPQPRLIRRAADIIRAGGLAAFPTDSAYALGGHLGDAGLLDRIRRIRGVDERHHFTLMCRDLSEIATYAKVDNAQYRLLKANTPGSYTFILEGSKELPRRVLHPRRKTIGLRIPDHPVALALLAELDEPLLSSTLLLPDEEDPPSSAQAIDERIGRQLDLIIDGGAADEHRAAATTVVNLAGGAPEIVRVGRGSLTPFGFE